MHACTCRNGRDWERLATGGGSLRRLYDLVDLPGMSRGDEGLIGTEYSVDKHEVVSFGDLWDRRL